jgi:hypothetical protein
MRIITDRLKNLVEPRLNSEQNARANDPLRLKRIWLKIKALPEIEPLFGDNKRVITIGSFHSVFKSNVIYCHDELKNFPHPFLDLKISKKVTESMEKTSCGAKLTRRETIRKR